MDTVTQAIGRTINAYDAYNKTQEDAIEIGDKLTAVVNNADVTMDAIRTGTSKFNSVANMTNQSVTDMAAAFGVLKDAGLSTEEAGTSLKTVLMRLEPSSKKGKEAIKELGVEVRNAEGKMKSMPKILEEFQAGLEGKGKKKQAALLKQIFGAQGIKGFTTLLNNAEGQYKELRKTIEESQGTAAETAKKMRTEWEKFTASVDALKHRVGAAVLPAFNAALTAINDIYKGIQKVGISFKPITKAVDALGLGFEYSEKAAKNLGKSIGKSINDAIKFTANLISRINKFWKENQSTIKSIGKFINNNVQGAIKNVVNFVSRLQEFWKKNKEELKEIWKQIGTKIKNAVVSIVSTVTDWIIRIEETRDIILDQKGLLKAIWNLIKSGYKAWNTVLDVVKFISTYLKVVIENIGRFINFIAQVITETDSAADAWSKIGEWLQKLIDWIGNFISSTSDLVSLVAKHLTKAWKTLGDWLEKAAGWIDEQLDFSSTLIDRVGNGLAGAWESVTGWVDDLIDKLGDIWDWVGNLIGKIGGGLIDKIKSAKDALSGLVGSGYGTQGTAQGLDGASAHLKPLLGIAQKHGVGVTSGLRPGDRTESGQVSYHAKGSALDFSGTPEQMKSFAQEVARRFGDQIHSIIYSGAPSAQRYKGQPHQFSPNIKDDHWDHVHVTAKQGQLSLGGQGSGYGVGGKQAVSDPCDNQDFQNTYKAATGKEYGDHEESPVTKAKRKLKEERQSDLKNKADDISRRTEEIEARIERVNKQINDLKAARSTKKQRGGDYQDDKDFTARIQELQEYRDEQKKLLEVENKLADTKLGDAIKGALEDGTQFVRSFSDQLNQLNRDFSDLSFSEKYQNKIKDMQDRFDELKDKISGLIEEQRKILEVDPSNQQAKRNLENLKEMGKVLEKKQAQAKEFIRNNHIADALEKGTEHVQTFSDKMNELNREFSDLSDHEKLQNKLADIENRFDSMKQTIDDLIEAQRQVLEVDPGNAEAQRNIRMLGQQKQELSKKEAQAKQYAREKHFEDATAGNASEYRQNRLDAYSRQRNLNKSLMDAQMAGVEGEYRRSQANYELERRKLRMETQSRISEAQTNPNLSDSERENIINQLERLEEIKLKNLQEDVKTLGEDLNNAFTGAVQEGLKGLITGTKTLGEALTGVLDKLTEFALNKAFQGLFGGGLGTGGGGVLGAAMGVATGGLFGGGGNPLNGGEIYSKLGFASGGLVPDVNSGKRNQKGDSVPAMLTPGEYVLNRQDTSKLFGQGSISAGEVAGFNSGGKVNSAAGGGNTFHFSTNVTLKGDRKGVNRAEQQQLQKNISSVVKQEISRQLQPGGLLS
jgi:TP901 family phage tail tape measure protein